MRIQSTKITCEKCGKEIGGGTLDIVTSLHEGQTWSRLHVVINHVHGMHSDAHRDPADLCRPCTIVMLADALKRVKAGERATAVVEQAAQSGWSV